MSGTPLWLQLLRDPSGALVTRLVAADDRDHHTGQLAFEQEFSNRRIAQQAERRVKALRRHRKDALVAGTWKLPLDEIERMGDPLSIVLPQDESWMQRALDTADAGDPREVPVGAVLVDTQGKLLSAASNACVSGNDPTAHAEILALRAAGAAIGNYRLTGCTLYVTLEPCAMCSMALVHARVARVVYAATDPKTGAAGSVFDILVSDRHNHRIEVLGGVLEPVAAEQLREFFRARR